MPPQFVRYAYWLHHLEFFQTANGTKHFTPMLKVRLLRPILKEIVVILKCNYKLSIKKI